MAKINPGLSLKYLSIVFCILSVVFATLYNRFDTFLLGSGVALLAYGYKMNLTTIIFISSLAIFLGAYLPFGRTSVSLIQGFSEGFAEENKISIAKTERLLMKQREYLDSDDTSVPDYCENLGRPSADGLLRLYSPPECLLMAKSSVNNNESRVPCAIRNDGQCLWLGTNENGKPMLLEGKGPSYKCARLNIIPPTIPSSTFDIGKKSNKTANSDFDPETEDQGSYYDKNRSWHEGPPLKEPKYEEKKIEGFENQESKKQKHVPPPDNSDRREMFELGKKYELPKETDDPEFHLDAGTTFLNAYKSLNPDQLSAMSKDTLDLINTQKQLMSTLNTLKPLITDGKQMMDTFQNYFGAGSGGNMGDLAKMAQQFAPK
jgi:hypothetical protein